MHNTNDTTRMCSICREVLADEKEGKAHLQNSHAEKVNQERANPNIEATINSVGGEKLSKVCVL